VDGTCLNLPDTPENRREYPQSKDPKPECGFPLLRLVGVFSLATGALLHRGYSPDTTSENALYQRLWATFEPGDLPLVQLSFKGCLDTAHHFSQVIAQLPVSHRKRRQTLSVPMLGVMAADLVPERPDRFEPRCRKRRPKRHPLMTQPRRMLKAAGVDRIRLKKWRTA
jgi:hypothetical protein